MSGFRIVGFDPKNQVLRTWEVGTDEVIERSTAGLLPSRVWGRVAVIGPRTYLLWSSGISRTDGQYAVVTDHIDYRVRSPDYGDPIARHPEQLDTLIFQHADDQLYTYTVGQVTLGPDGARIIPLSDSITSSDPACLLPGPVTTSSLITAKRTVEPCFDEFGRPRELYWADGGIVMRGSEYKLSILRSEITQWEGCLGIIGYDRRIDRYLTFYRRPPGLQLRYQLPKEFQVMGELRIALDDTQYRRVASQWPSLLGAILPDTLTRYLLQAF